MVEKSCTTDKEMILYTIEDIQRIFNLGRTKAYQLASMRGFPSIKLNRKIYIPKEKLESWVLKNTGKSLNY